MAVGLTVLAFFGVLVMVSVVVIVILLTMGNQFANVFSNVAAALTSP
jgi:Flp pilus assembly pilin Flp